VAPGTQKHASSKAVELDDSRSAYQLLSPGRVSQVGPADIRAMDHSKVLHTDIKQYLDVDAHITGISTVNDIREKKKVLSYKYSAHMNSNYGSKFKNTKGAIKQGVWNLDEEKRKLRVPYQPPKNFTTSYGGNFINSKGSGQIGSYDHMVRQDGTYGIDRKRQPKAEMDDGVPKAFAANSSYSVRFPVYGKLPEPNKMAPKKFNAGFGDMKSQSAYKSTFNGEG
jgi:hypothetical protein